MTAARDESRAIAAWLAALPGGLASYPQCKVRGDVFRAARQKVRGRFDPNVYGEAFASYVNSDDEPDWLPDTYGTLLNMLVRQHCYGTDKEALDWVHTASTEIFERPLYRVLIFLLSPTLLALGATSRWSAFRQGSTLERGKVREVDDRLVVRAALTYPEGLYSDFMLRTIAVTLQAAVDAAKAQHSAGAVTDASAGRAVLEVSWVK